MDSIVLADHICIGTEKEKKLLDIGTGTGIIPILLACKYPEISITGVEIQKELSYIAQKNVTVNHMENNIRILKKDIRKTDLTNVNGSQDIIVSNPPYKKKGSGRINTNIQKAVAKHEIKLSLEELIKSVKRLLMPNGKFYMIYPAERCPEMFYTLCRYNIMPDQIRFIHTKRHTPAKRVIIKCIKGGSQPVTVCPPLFTHEKI